MIDCSHVVEKVWIGSKPPRGMALYDAGFQTLALCAEEIQPRGIEFPGLLVIHAPMDDAEMTEEVREIAHEAADVLFHQWRRGDRVLVTCAAGRNRSGLVTALLVRRIYGVSGREARQRVQTRREDALTNPYFARYLDGLGAPGVAILERRSA